MSRVTKDQKAGLEFGKKACSQTEKFIMSVCAMILKISLQIKKIIKLVVPPVLVKMANHLRLHHFENVDARTGNYGSWQEARRATTGYDADNIFNKVRDASLKVKKGEAVYERDSVLFDKIEYVYPVIAVLLRAAVADEGKLSVLDFGGSLGTSYYQSRGYLSKLKHLRWNIVEQEKFVTYGKELFEDDILKFYYNIGECLRIEKPHVALIAGVLPYLEKPFQLIEILLSHNFHYIVIDRTNVLENTPTRLTVQKVPPSIYEASLPCWIFNEKQLLKSFEKNYRLLGDFESYPGSVIDLGSEYAKYKGYIFEQR